MPEEDKIVGDCWSHCLYPCFVGFFGEVIENFREIDDISLLLATDRWSASATELLIELGRVSGRGLCQQYRNLYTY